MSEKIDRTIPELGAGTSQTNVASHPVEKPDFDLAFECRDRLADRQLNQIERVGGARDVLMLREHDEDAKLLQRQAHLPSSDA